MSQGRRRLAAIMFTDMIGYTALGQRNELLSLAMVEAQRKLVRPILQKHSGREVKTMGDSFLVEFHSALDAVRCAYDIQRTTREFNFSMPEDRRIHLRVGVHVGDVVESRGDVSGDAVNVASRIETLAEDDGVCLTRQVYDHVQNKFDLPLASLGSHVLKNVSGPVEVYKIMMPWSEAEQAVREPDKHRIAVLPFTNMSPDTNDEYFADGLTEELISAVSSIGELDVISRTSVMSLKGTRKKVSEIGKELQVGSVLEGSVRKAGNKIRIMVQQIETQTDRHIWSQSYDRTLDDIFELQSEIAKQVAEKLSVKILPHEITIIEKERTKDPEAYLLYMRGRHYWNERNKEAVLNAIKYFEKAVTLDPNFALAYSGLADSYNVMSGFLFMPRKEAVAKIMRYASKAVELDDLSAEAHTSMATALLKEYDWAGAEKQFQRALELNPSYATAHHWYASYLVSFRRFDEALREGRRAERLDPLSPILHVFIGACLRDMNQLNLAEGKLNETIEIWPDFYPAWLQLSMVHNSQGKFEEAARDLERLSSLGIEPTVLKIFRGILLAGTGKTDEAKTVLREMSEVHLADLELPYIALCIVLGEQEKAVQIVLDSHETRPDILSMLASDLNFESVRKDPRVQEILKRIGLPP